MAYINYKKLKFIIILQILLGVPVSAQNKWTLKQCIDYANEHSISIKQQKNAVNKLNEETKSLKNSYLPDLNLSTSQKFDFGRSLNRSNTYEDINSQNTYFSLVTEVTLFNGFKTTNSITKSKFDLKAAFENLEEIKNDLALNITTCYFQVLLNKEIAQIAKKQIELIEEQEKQTKVLVDNGKVPQSQLYDVFAQKADDELKATETSNSLKLSLLDLAQLLELEDKEAFDVCEYSLQTDSIITNLPDGIYDFAKENMPQIKRAKHTLTSSLAAIKVAKSGYYPTLSLGAGISSNYYHIGGNNNSAFGEQFRNNMQKTIYLTLNVPLFDKFSTKKNISNARTDADNSRLSLENEQKTLYKKIQKAYLDAIAAKEKFVSTSKSVQANSEAHRYAKEKYMAGKSTVYEYNESKMKLANALSEQAQAKYTYLLKIRILDFYSGKPLNE